MSNNRNRSGPRSRRGNTPTPPPMSVSPVVVIPKTVNVTQAMAAAKAPPPEPAPKAREPFAIVASAPPPVVRDPPASVVPPVTLVARENGHSNGSTKQQLSKTLVEFAQSVPKAPESKPSLISDSPKPTGSPQSPGGLLAVEPSSTSNGNKAGPAPWQGPVRIDEPHVEAKRVPTPGPLGDAPKPPASESYRDSYRPDKPEPVTRVESPESRRGAESKRDPGASGKHSEIDERFFEEGTRSERDMMAARDQIASDAGMELDGVDEKAAYKMRPEVRARRAKNARYVMWATAGV